MDSRRSEVYMRAEQDILAPRPGRWRRVLRRLPYSPVVTVAIALSIGLTVLALAFALVHESDRRIGSSMASSTVTAASRAEELVLQRRPNNAMSLPFTRVSSSDPTSTAPLPWSAFPIERGVCGTGWPQKFADLQAKSLAQGAESAHRYTVMRSQRGDLPQRLAGAVTAAMHALVAGRGFQYDWLGNHYLWDAMRSHYIDWRYSAVDSFSNSLLLDFWAADKQLNYTYTMTEGDLASVGSNYDTVAWSASRGMTSRAAAQNVRLGSHLHSMGLRPDTAFPCLFDFLFRPTSAAFLHYEAELKELLDPGSLRIAIEIATAPTGGAPGFATASGTYAAYFKCAREIEAQLALPGQRVVWLLVTDSAALRVAVRDEYGSKLVGRGGSSLPLNLADPSKQDAALAAAAAELWLMSLADAHVISHDSGTGRLGSVLSMRWRRTFVMPPVSGKGEQLYASRSCRLEDADSFDSVTSQWTGL